MTEQEETYCRLCAEPTPKTQMISPDEDVAVTLKIEAKMHWINIDITSSNLPSTVCFSCFDLLERTWSFLHNVRTAQQKLLTIFSPKSSSENDASNDDVKPDQFKNVGKPVDTNWEEFQNAKTEVKHDPEDAIETVDPNTLIMDNLINFSMVKAEKESSVEGNNDGFNSSDSDEPLHTLHKKKTKIFKVNLNRILDEETFDIKTVNMTWEEYMCRCAKCDALCKNITSLRLHSLQIHSCCCVFKCSDCGKVIANFKSFVRHVRFHKKVLRYCCEICNKHFKMTAYLKKHYTAEHSDDYLSTCQNCGATFESQELLQDHMLIYTKTYKKRKRDKRNEDLKCEHCSKEFKTKSNLNQHKLVHTERSRDFSCHVCGKMFFTKGTLCTHMSTHEDTKPYKCEYCPMTFRARGNMQSHISLHSGAKPFVCEQCGKSFRVKDT